MDLNERWERLQKFKEKLDIVIKDSYDVLKKSKEKKQMIQKQKEKTVDLSN
ncbi:MAG: hypothetical protein ACK4UJ_11910 [Leptonema sp. (in: bacteria)]